MYYLFAMLKLGRPPFTDLQGQLAAFLDAAKADRGSKVVLALRLLAVELRQYPDGGASDQAKAVAQQRCLDDLGDLAAELKATVKAGGEAAPEAVLWWRRVTMSMVNAAVRVSNWRVALVLLEALRRSARVSSSGAPPLDAASRSTFEVEVLSRIGKVFLQMGNLDEAASYFAQVDAADAERRAAAAAAARVAVASVAPSPRARLNGGLLAFAKNEFREAMGVFREVIEAERKRQGERQFTFDQPTVGAVAGAVSDNEVSTLFCGLDIEENLMSEAVNNLAICAMYTCDLELAVTTLEKLIREVRARRHALLPWCGGRSVVAACDAACVCVVRTRRRTWWTASSSTCAPCTSSPATMR
jgi:tetratricopeptide (TPR) repeat protein